MQRLKLTLIFLLLIFSFKIFAQNIDDTTKVYHSPKKATIMSACLPGLGQIYNHKYWKVPIVYIGLGGATYGFFWNHDKYSTFHDAYAMRVDGDSSTVDNFEGLYSESNLLDLSNYYRRNMELSVIIFTFVYIINIIDATVDAHLYDFDISDDLSMRIQPSMWCLQGVYGPSMGAGFTINLRF